MAGANGRQAALLIDADNLSADGMAEALQHLSGQGMDVTVRRAYGSHETLATIKDFLQSHSMRAIINQGKGTTDAALVVDAMELMYTGSLPDVVAIGSADADFAPLAVRLRESGRRVVCFAQRRKAAEGLDRFYADVVYVDSPAREARAPARKAAAEPAPPRKTPRKRAAAAPPPPAPAPTPEPTPSDRVRALLESIPGFLEGRDLELNTVVKRLRDEQLMAKSTSARIFFRKHAPDVLLLPERQPNKLRRAR